MPSYILDNQIVLDILIPRVEEYPESLKLFRYIISNEVPLFLSSSQLSNLEYVLYHEIRKANNTFTRKDNKELLNNFYQLFTIIKTPSYVDVQNKLYLLDSEDYMVELSAKAIDAEIITRDKIFLKESEIAITIEEFLQQQTKKNEVKFLDLKKQYLSINQEIDHAVDKVINSSSFIGNKYVEQFEENFAAYQQAKHCVGVGNGTDALEIAIEVLDLPKGSEIIVPANSFIASAEAVTRTGHKIVFCDVNADDYTIKIKDLKRRITPQTSAIMAVHLYGHPCDMDPLIAIADEYNLKVIEDCAQAHGAEYKGNRVGAIGNLGCFSFYPGKNLGAYGDGGAIVTNDEGLATRSRMIANHGRIAKYDHQFEGRNSRLDGIQAAILDVKLKYLDEWTLNRIMIANEYLEGLKNITDIITPVRKEWAKHVYHLFVIRYSKRDKLQEKLKVAGIQTGIHYPMALPKLQAFRYTGQSGETGKAWKNDKTILSLPIGDTMSKDDVCTSISSLKNALNLL